MVDSLEHDINATKSFLPTEQAQKTRKLTGRSPIISGHMILQKCYNQGLGQFINDPEIWKDSKINSGTNSPKAKNSETK